MTLRGEILGTLGQDNEFYPIPEMPFSSYTLCSGLHLREDHYMFDVSAFEMSFRLHKEHWQSGAYCDTDSMMGETDPRRLYFENDPGRQSRMMEELERVESG